MNRRDLIKSLGAVACVPLVPSVLEEKVFRPDDTHRCFNLLWSGWLQIPNQSILVGHWIAYDPKRRDSWQVYSSYPGETYKFFPGQLFNTAIQKDQKPPSRVNTAKDLMGFCRRAHERIIQYIDEHYEELIA